jgi:hypothetical protein
MSDDRPPEPPTGLTKWLRYVKLYERDIFVRAQVDGKWTNVALADLPPEEWADNVARWLYEGRLPVRMLEESERQLELHREQDPAPDHTREFMEAILDYTPTISKSGNQLMIIFDGPAQAAYVYDLLWHAIESAKES